MANEGTLNKVRAVAEQYHIPEWIWRPIMDMESGGNPKEWNRPQDNGGKEDSRGLFQINVMANPQYAGKDLFDPTVNATIGLRDFIAPAYAQVKSNVNLGVGGKAAYVWKNGIRPAWSDAKNAAIQQKAESYFNASAPWWAKISGGITKDITGENPVNPTPDPAPPDPNEAAKGGGSWFEKIFGISPGSFMTSLQSKTLSAVLLIVGIVLLIMALKSMLLGGGTTE